MDKLMSEYQVKFIMFTRKQACVDQINVHCSFSCRCLLQSKVSRIPWRCETSGRSSMFRNRTSPLKSMAAKVTC
jgi:hypothetical protein